jgi:UDP-N-acetylglucosamine acyltransferase
MAASIHATAIVDPRARLAGSVTVGAYSIVDGDVEIGEGTSIGPHCVITGHTRIGRENRIFQFNSIGEANQDKKYKGEPTRLEIGERNTIREFCTFNRGTVQDAGVTRIGSDNWFMAYSHVAHDCVVGDNTVFANHATLGGHVHVGDWAVLGGFCGVHQFVRIGAHVMASALSYINQDVPPYVTVQGAPCSPHGINAEGLKRRGFTPEAIAAIKRAYRTLYRSGLKFDEARSAIAEAAAAQPELAALAEFLAASVRGIAR